MLKWAMNQWYGQCQLSLHRVVIKPLVMLVQSSVAARRCPARRALVAASRVSKASVKGAGRLRKYLSHFGLDRPRLRTKDRQRAS